MRTIETLDCPICGKEFQRHIYSTIKTCSLSCGAKLRWKGTAVSLRIKSHPGYIFHLVPDDHPYGRDVNAGRGKYIYEHRLVMEKRLGRYLVPGEEVHHKDGNRANNEDSNLELWQVRQPRGVRVKDNCCNNCCGCCFTE